MHAPNVPAQALNHSFFFRLNSAALPVKTWSQARDCFVPWSTKCRLCPHEETTEHYFIDYRDAIFFWDILQRTLKKEDDVTPISILFCLSEIPKIPLMACSYWVAYIVFGKVGCAIDMQKPLGQQNSFGGKQGLMYTVCMSLKSLSLSGCLC